MNLKHISWNRTFASLALAATVFLSMPTMAEGNHQGRRGHSPEQMVQRLQEKLDLNEAQVAQVKAIFESHQAEFQRLKEEMKQTLTDQQREAIKQARENRKGEKGEKRQRPSAEERQQRMAQLGITEGQQQQLKSLRQQMKTEREAIKSEMMTVLTPEQQTKLESMKSRHKGQRGKRSQRTQE